MWKAARSYMQYMGKTVKDKKGSPKPAYKYPPSSGGKRSSSSSSQETCEEKESHGVACAQSVGSSLSWSLEKWEDSE